MNLKNNLIPQYIAYLDVLGFKELVNSKDTEKLQTYFATVRQILEAFKINKKKIQSLLISDSIILVSPDSKEDFFTLLIAVQTIQAHLLRKDIFLRGAICFGEVYYDEELNIIVGKGLIDAYQLEQEAKFPRVIINAAIIPRIGKNSQEFLEEVNFREPFYERNLTKLVHTWGTYLQNDVFFVSYAHRIVTESLPARDLYETHKIISDNLYNKHSNYEKYLWVKRYFMDVLRDFKERHSTNGSQNSEAEHKYYEEWYTKFSEL